MIGLCTSNEITLVLTRVSRTDVKKGFGGDFLRFALADTPTDSVSMRVGEEWDIWAVRHVYHQLDRMELSRHAVRVGTLSF